MIEEQKPVEETPAAASTPEGTPVAESPDSQATPPIAHNSSADGAEELIPELIDDRPTSEIDLDAVGSAVDGAPPVTATADDTDYEAAFIDLRTTYAAKERECEALKAESEDKHNQYLRLAADFENFRRRTQKEKEEIVDQTKCDTVGELLSVVDNFERARSQLKPQTDSEMVIHKSYQGVYKDMVDRLKKIGVSPMRAEGQPFDPNFHNAVLREPTAEHPEGTVVEELMRGYLIGERVLRHAMVKVAAPPEDDAPASEESASS
jgi:molecular chaperone GrpE